jgi:hypothetical protein
MKRSAPAGSRKKAVQSSKQQERRGKTTEDKETFW